MRSWIYGRSDLRRQVSLNVYEDVELQNSHLWTFLERQVPTRQLQSRRKCYLASLLDLNMSEVVLILDGFQIFSAASTAGTAKKKFAHRRILSDNTITVFYLVYLLNSRT